MSRANDILAAILESDEDDFDAKELAGVDPEALERQLREILPIAIDRKEKYLGSRCRWTSAPFTNPHGEQFVFGQFGPSGSRGTMSTLLYLNPNKGWQIAESQEDEEDDEDYKDVYYSDETPVKYLSLGTISSGTMREEDVMPAMLDALELVAPEEAKQVREDYEGEILTYNPDFCWSTLFYLVQKHCPPYTYVGPNPGDGADYGVWVNDEAIEDGLDSDSDEINGFVRGERMPTNTKYAVMLDAAGNYVALFDCATGKEIWSV